jgi:hypothetical protein
MEGGFAVLHLPTALSSMNRFSKRDSTFCDESWDFSKEILTGQLNGAYRMMLPNKHFLE